MVAAILAACSSPPPKAAPPAPATATTATTTPAARPARAVLCPLTGALGPGGRVPDHPGVAVKVENLPSARPQYGLDKADLVYEEPVEGGITRFLAVFQCQSAPRIEPVRSSRLVDADILPQLGHPVFGFAGGIGPSVGAVDSSGAIPVNFITDAAPFTLDPARLAPHNVETSTGALLAAAGRPKGAPRPIFTYSANPPAGEPASVIHLDISPESDVYWRWDPAVRRYRRYYGASAAVLGDGILIQAANVVVEEVVVTPSPYAEDATGVHENFVYADGSGPAEVARNGIVVHGRWLHPIPAAPTRLVDAAGNPIPLAPGPTWIELLPTTSPASPAP